MVERQCLLSSLCLLCVAVCSNGFFFVCAADRPYVTVYCAVLCCTVHRCTGVSVSFLHLPLASEAPYKIQDVKRWTLGIIRKIFTWFINRKILQRRSIKDGSKLFTRCAISKCKVATIVHFEIAHLVHNCISNPSNSQDWEGSLLESGGQS